MVTLDDLSAAVVARCLASADFAAALPGKAWLDRGPDQPDGAYSVFTLERDGDAEWDSGGVYLQGYTLRMVAYVPQIPDPPGCPTAPAPVAPAQEAQLAMASALNPNPTSWTALRAGYVNCCLPAGYDGKHAPELREGRDVFAAAGQWKLLIEGSR